MSFSVVLFVCFTFIFTTYVFHDVVFLVSLSRFHNTSIKLEDIESLEEIRTLVDELKREMSLLSVSESRSTFYHNTLQT